MTIVQPGSAITTVPLSDATSRPSADTITVAGTLAPYVERSGPAISSGTSTRTGPSPGGRSAVPDRPSPLTRTDRAPSPRTRVSSTRSNWRGSSSLPANNSGEETWVISTVTMSGSVESGQGRETTLSVVGPDSEGSISGIPANPQEYARETP